MRSAPKLNPEYVIDVNGNKKAVILSIEEYEELIEDLRDLAVVAERREEPVVLSAYHLDIVLHEGKFIFDDVPQYLVFEDVVAVSQHVPQTNDFMKVTNLLGKNRMVPSQAGQCFADDLKLTFNNQLQCTIFLKIMEGPAVAKGFDFLDGSQDVLAKLVGIMQHR